MKEKFDRLSAECSRITTQRYSTSFSLGIRFLNKRLHEPIFGIYGFVRLADEIVDSFHDYNKASLLDRFKKDCFDAIENGISLNPILNSFQQVVKDYEIDHELIHAFLRSMEMDLDKRVYNEEQYQQYILGSAQVVGLMCLFVFTEGNPSLYYELMPAAMKLGSAFQKVNFLRDIGADFRQLNRTYFPDLDLKNFTDDDKHRIENDIEGELNEALAGIKKLPESSRRGVYLAYQYYRNLFEKIRLSSACTIFSRRFHLSNARKMILLCDMLLKRQMKLI
ncbi:MAG TPA: phytoene/squalene synthase family protein [Mucilaginibacter sp.]|jgi:phytoene/squalene synthetase|nr:phytoene/squalene synthase family protein [Mucilaginibacter sp.]